jgi:phosphoglycolate phosphatase
VGDTIADVRAARAAGVPAVVVTSGPDDEATLRAAGADVVLGSLEELPAALPALLATSTSTASASATPTLEP